MIKWGEINGRKFYSKVYTWINDENETIEITTTKI